jgi:ATP-dependent DNA helicase RecG
MHDALRCLLVTSNSKRVASIITDWMRRVQSVERNTRGTQDGRGQIEIIPALGSALRWNVHVHLLLWLKSRRRFSAPVMVTGNGYPLRVGDTIVKMEEPKIRALKLERLAESWINRPSPMTLADLDLALIARAKAGAGYPDLSDTEYLLKRKHADRKGSGLVLRRAAELLFAREPDHANAGVRIFQVLGTEIRVGALYNVEEKKPRIEGPLPDVIAQTFTIVAPLLRKPSRLRGIRFKETPEYPEFAWREAILNAIGHRDYGNQGRGVEVHLFDDRMEVTSPGGLTTEVRIQALRARERTHQSRNPRLVRALVDLGCVLRSEGDRVARRTGTHTSARCRTRRREPSIPRRRPSAS